MWAGHPNRDVVAASSDCALAFMEEYASLFSFSSDVKCSGQITASLATADTKIKLKS
jgi:hypothetical protein